MNHEIDITMRQVIKNKIKIQKYNFHTVYPVLNSLIYKLNKRMAVYKKDQ